MARRSTITAESIEKRLDEYQQSGLGQREYCEKAGIRVTTLHYYQRRLRQLREADSGDGAKAVAKPAVRLAKVTVSGTRKPLAADAFSTRHEFTLGLCNGRRIELPSWEYREEDLARLIRLAEQV